jgi:hypothetical protein
MAMTKLDYKHGLFLTNAKISPQAKREYLNDYPDLELDFLDGEELAREVLSNGVLTGLWWEGTQFSQINVSTIFPMIIRLHNEDMPFNPIESSTEQDAQAFFEYLGSRHPNYRFSLEPGRSSTEPFEPYRAPEPLTMEEGTLPFIRLIEVATTGQVAFSEFPTLSQSICKATCAWLLPKYGGISVRVGRPEIVPLQGANSGKRILTDIGAISFTATHYFCAEELDWFAAEPDHNWSSKSDARVTEAPWIRLYTEELDCCLAYEIRTRISSARRAWEEALRETSLRGWEASVFCLVPAWQEWPYPEIPEPDEIVRWPWDGRILCGWFHWSILGGPVKIRSAQESPFVFPDEEQTSKRLTHIAELLQTLDGCQMLQPDEARHMVALAGTDPFPDLGFAIIDTADVIVNSEVLPSPIRPEARRFRVSIAWRTDVGIKELEAETDEASGTIDPKILTSAWHEQWDEYVISHFELAPTQYAIAPTETLVTEIFNWLKLLIPEIQKSLNRRGNAQVATKEVWSKRFEVNFGMSWEESDKCYVGTINPDGSIEKVSGKTFLEHGLEAAIKERDQGKSEA